MKTAEQYLKIWQGEEVVITKNIAIIAMMEYGRQCAEQALKDAAENAYALNDPSSYQIEQSILSTPILTP